MLRRNDVARLFHNGIVSRASDPLKDDAAQSCQIQYRNY